MFRSITATTVARFAKPISRINSYQKSLFVLYQTSLFVPIDFDIFVPNKFYRSFFSVLDQEQTMYYSWLETPEEAEKRQESGKKIDQPKVTDDFDYEYWSNLSEKHARGFNKNTKQDLRKDKNNDKDND